ncbi:MAG: O-antigen ligase family protein [Oscillospiraceae bacterium]|nr:O-antigen ligase family protein [Oscillospiraceae bacterium]
MPKTIFNTTEKSNFILNMKTEEYRNFLMKILIGYLILMPIFCIPLEFFKIYSVPAMAFAVIGVFAMVFAFIGFMKQITPKSLILPAGLLGGLVAWSVVSLINSYNYSISLTGSDGRNEGVFSVVFYGCLFLLGAQLVTEQNHKKLLDAMLWYGLAQCAWALLQVLPIGFPSYYAALEPMLLFRVFLPSGLTGSPIFLATLLVTLSVPAIIGAVKEEDKKSRIFYLICAAMFVLMAVKTQTLIGFAGSILSLAGTGIYLIAKRSGKKAFGSYAAVMLAFVIGMGWAFASPAINGTFSRASGSEVAQSAGFRLYDGGVMWDDSSYRLAVSGYYVANGSDNPNGHFDINSLTESYGYLWKATLGVIGRFPLVGSGPDNLVYPQMYQHHQVVSNPNVFDRCYNYYLHLAGTMGIPALLLYLALMGIVVFRGAKFCKTGNWLHAGIYGAVLMYLLAMGIGTSSVTVAPIFWVLAGIVVTDGMALKENVKK